MRGWRVSFCLVACSIIWGCSGDSNSEESDGVIAQVSTSVPVSTIVPTSMATSTIVETTTTLAPVYTCDPLPESDLVLNIETDLDEAQIAPFLCGIHAAAAELKVEDLELNLSMFEDMAAMKESMERLVPGLVFESSSAANGYYGLIGTNVIFWNYPNTVRERDEFAFVFRVGTHEFFHAVQSTYTSTGDLRGFATWLIEGSAEYFALMMLEKYGFDEHLERWTNFGKIFALNYAVDPGSLRTWETPGPYGEGRAPFLNYPLVADIAKRLADMTSDEAVLETFWREKRPDETWPVTFERVFGMPVEDFYAVIDEEFLAAGSS